MADAVQKLPKPQLRGLLHSQIKRNLAVSIVLALISGAIMKRFICDERKQRYADFYKTYDADADFERMRALGLFQYAPPDE